MKYLALLLLFFLPSSTFSQIQNKIPGTWVYSGNNVYLYDFADSGKVYVTTCKNKAVPTLIESGWRITQDSLLYLKEKRKNTVTEYSYKVIEVSSSKMVLLYPANGYTLVFYRVEPNKHSRPALADDFFINKTFTLDPSIDTLSTKLSFKENGACTHYRKGRSGEQVAHESDWTLLHRADNTFLLIDDLEIFVVTKKNEKRSELELRPYGFLRSISGLDSVTLRKTED